MSRKTAHKCFHFSVIFVEVMAIVLLVFALLMAVLIGRMSSRPMPIDFAKDFIQSSLYDHDTGNYVVMDNVALYWPDIRGPLYLQLQNAKILNPEEKPIVSVDEAALSFSRSSLLTGRIRPKSIILNRPSLRIARKEGNTIDFGFGAAGDWGSTLSDGLDGEQAALTTRVFEYIARPGRESRRNSLISRLEAFEIENANLIVEDHVLGMTWYLPDFNAGFFSRFDGMRGNFDVKLPDVDATPSGLHVAMEYIWDAHDLSISADIKNLDTMILAGKLPAFDMLREQEMKLDAHIETILGPDFIPKKAGLLLTSEQGSLFHADLSKTPIPYKGLHVGVSYDGVEKSWKIQGTQVTLSGVTVSVKADLKQDGPEITGPVHAAIDRLPQEEIDALWPEILRGDASEEWIVQKMSDGVFKDMSLDFDLVLGRAQGPLQDEQGQAPWHVDARNLKAGFAFENMSVDYRAPLFPAKKASGSGHFDLDTDIMTVTINKASIGNLEVVAAKLVFDEIVAEGRGGVDMGVRLKGALPDVLAYVSEEPINLDGDTDLDFNTVEGMADLNVSLAFPTRKNVKLEDFTIGVEGTLSDVLIPDIVGDLDVSGGPLDLRVKGGRITVSGEALLEKRAMTFEWMEFLESEGKPYVGKVEAHVTADPNLRQRMGIDLSEFIEGSVPVHVTYTSQGGGKSKAEVRADITPATFFVAPFDFVKAPGVKGEAKLTAHLVNKELREITKMSARGQDFKLSPSRLLFHKNKAGQTQLTQGELNSFRLGETTGKLTFKYDKNRAVKMVLGAPFLDVRPFLAEKETKAPYNAPPMIISVSANQMRTADGETVKDAKLYIDIDGQGRFNQMEMDARAGNGDIYMRFKPDPSGKRTFRLETDDAGAALKAFQVYKNIRGGKLLIYGQPIRGVFDRNLSGVAEITDFKVVKAPALTKLLSIMSLPGLIEVLSSDGLEFARLEADFNWVYRKNGSLLVLKEGRTSGNSIGLTFDGTFDNAKRQVDVSGTIIPMSGINAFIGSIPLIGDLLTGGSGSVIAATYSIKGKSEDPNILVNPLSVLTPGILRRILFE